MCFYIALACDIFVSYSAECSRIIHSLSLSLFFLSLILSSLLASFQYDRHFRGCSCSSDLTSNASAVTCGTSDQVTNDESDSIGKQTRDSEAKDTSSRATSSCSTVNYEAFEATVGQKYPCDDDEDTERAATAGDNGKTVRGASVSSVHSSNISNVKCAGNEETLRDGKNYTNSSSNLAMGTIAKAIVNVSSSAVKRRRQSLQFLVSSVPSFHRSLNKRRSEFDLASALQDQQSKVSTFSLSLSPSLNVNLRCKVIVQ